MNGLEAVELKLSEVLIENENGRIDSEYFKRDLINFLNNLKNLEPLKNFVNNGYRVVYESTHIIDSDIGLRENHPYFLQATDLETPFINKDNLFYVDNADWIRYPMGRISKGELLIEVKGKAEKVSIVPIDFPEKTLVSGSLYKLTVNDKINKYYLLAYLICKYGESFKNRYKSNLLISYINKDDLYRIPIPIYSVELQRKIQEIFESCFEVNNNSKSLYAQAEQLLLDELGLHNWKPTEANTEVKSFKNSFLESGRLDAEFYQPKYDEIEDKIFNYSNGFDLISNHFKINREEPDWKLNEYKYIEIGDVNVSNGVSAYNILSKEELPANAKILLKKGDIIISKVRPYRGAVSIIDFDYPDLVGSGAFCILQESSHLISKECIAVLLRSSIYKELMMKFNVGSSYPVIKDEDILNLPIPLLPEEQQQEVAQLIQQSFQLKKQSEQLLQTAKQAVEIAIEEGEEKAMLFIKKLSYGS